MTAVARTRLQQQVTDAQAELDRVIGAELGNDAWYWQISHARRALAQAYLEVSAVYRPQGFVWGMARDLYKATARIADEDERDAMRHARCGTREGLSDHLFHGIPLCRPCRDLLGELQAAPDGLVKT
jgi:hypothetical protein